MKGSQDTLFLWQWTWVITPDMWIAARCVLCSRWPGFSPHPACHGLACLHLAPWLRLLLENCQWLPA